MELTTQTSSDVLVVSVEADRIDAAVAILFKDRMREVTREAPSRVILDLGTVAFIDSSGLGAVVAAMKSLEGNRRLELAGLTPTVAKVFRLTRLDSVFTVHPDVASGLGVLRDAG